MGSFYVNITLRGPQQDQIAQALADQKRSAYISPTVDGSTVVYDKECESQDPHRIHQLTAHLSRILACPALAILNHDDDILWYQLHDDGHLVDEYNSCPDCLDPAEGPGPRGGNAQTLCDLMCGPDAAAHGVAAIESILSKSAEEADGYLFELDRHEDLAEVLGLPTFAVGFGYRYLEQEAQFEGIDLSEFIRLEKGQWVEANDSFEFGAWDYAQPPIAGRPPETRVWHSPAQETVGVSAEDAVESARRQLGSEGHAGAECTNLETWLVSRAGRPAWMVIFLSPTANVPSTVVYVDAETGKAVESRPFLKGK